MFEAKRLRQLRYYGSAATKEQYPAETLPEVLLLGRSNVGKSSLINALSGQKRLARVSGTPGKTRQIIYFEQPGSFFITDLPGYGYAKTSKDEKARFSELTDSYFRSGRQLALCLLLMDIRRDIGEYDKTMLNYLSHTGLSFAAVLTKSDKLSAKKAADKAAGLKNELSQFKNLKIFVISSEKRSGLFELESFILETVKKGDFH